MAPTSSNSSTSGRKSNLKSASSTASSSTPAAKVSLKTKHALQLKETEAFKKKKKTIQDHNRRLNTIYAWIEKEYKDYFNQVCKPVTDEQKQDKLQYYAAKYVFNFDKLDAKIITAFISANKIKSTGEDGNHTYYSYVNLRKYVDAVKFAASREKHALAPIFYLQLKEHLDTCKKENTQKRAEGKVEEKEADPISFPLMLEICKWAVQLGWVTVWAFSVLQWHCMARSINIGALTFQNLGIGKDSIVVKFNSTKKDQTGEKVTPKNCFSNPFNYLMCVTTALGCYFAINDEFFENGRRKLFQSQNAKNDTACHNYCENLVKLFKKMGDRLWHFVRPGHVNGHGIRKGASVHVTSATTCPPPPSSVARRGEWSLGKIFDIYWLFAEAGDQYCGRILAGLDPMSVEFDVLPPHFTCGIEDEDVKNALKINFRSIFKIAEEDDRSSLMAILLRCLASIIHHSDSLIAIISTNPSHPFMNIPVLSRPILLQTLKTKITTKPSSIIEAPTGIPPHVKQMRMVNEIFKHLKDERQAMMQLEEKLVKVVETTIENHALTNGHITAASIQTIFQNHQKHIHDKLHHQRLLTDQKLDHVIGLLNRSSDYHAPPPPLPMFPMNLGQERNFVRSDTDENGIKRHLHYWDGKYWHVPKNFQFPKSCSRRRAFDLWLLGLPNFKTVDGKDAPIMPFRRMKPKYLPKVSASKLKIDWVPVMTKMLSAPNLPEGIANANTLSNEKIEEAYAVGTAYLKNQVSYIFTKPQFKGHCTWSVATWSLRLRYSQIKKYGTVEDIANLPEPTKKNQPRKRNERSNNGSGN